MVVKHVEISVIEAEELPVGDANGLSDPYVTIDFCPGNIRLLKTSVQPETLNPKWNEVYEVGVDIDAQDGEFLIAVKDKDIIGCDHLCYLVVPLKQLLKTGEIDSWFPLTKKLRSYADIGYGRLHLGFRIRDYEPPQHQQASRSQSMTSYTSTNSIGARNGPNTISDAEKRFLYAQERERSATERLDENCL